ncbi:unnamed protein product [Pleuronectes platessa]|uniref:Uncharacterized protein n=1 Tax=Pleuronectes platessa TaxID=8262 RepID=A0A9N7ZD80_PLEPL|nr:unnamed protein product [Pleuronectes platessa]
MSAHLNKPQSLNGVRRKDEETQREPVEVQMIPVKALNGVSGREEVVKLFIVTAALLLPLRPSLVAVSGLSSEWTCHLVPDHHTLAGDRTAVVSSTGTVASTS